MPDPNHEAAHQLAARLKGREADSLEWRDHPDGGWLVGPFLMNNHAKFRVEETDGTFRVARTWFATWDQQKPYPPKELGEADSREEAETLIRQSIETDGIWSLHHADSPHAHRNEEIRRNR
ncbi:hypothetical protein ACWEDZ_02840 [Streptomyces sp. NPDC005047]